MKVTVDQNSCIGCGMCFDICPEIFICNDDSKSEVNQENSVESFEDKIKEARDICPVSAIIVED